MTIEQIKSRKLEIRSLLEQDDADLTALEVELRDLEAQEEKIQKRAALISAVASGEVETRKIDKPGDDKMDKEMEVRKASEQRGKELYEKRSVTLSNNVILPRYDATDIKPTFNQVSSLLDRVGIRVLLGGESYRQPYLTNYGTGGLTAEEANYTTAEPTFNYATIDKAKITAYAEDTEEVLKLPLANYDAEVVNGITIALRKRITSQILIGAGTSNTFTGIFSSNASAIDAATDISIVDIDETTLDEIIYSYGGNEDVESTAVLIINKLDLKKFATLRTNDGEKIYTVINNGNTGTIDGVPYIINSECKATATATTGQYLMAYGSLANYTMTVFSPIEVQRSMDYQFKNGNIAHRGAIFAGGNVTSRNGFLRVKRT
jgi:HK97 family phage major capsid protein